MLSAEGYSPRVLQTLVRQGGKAASFADACDDLAELSHVQISAKHLERLVERVGGEWAAARDADVAAFEAGRLERDYPQPPPPDVVGAVMLDGGRVQTRAAERGPGVHEPGWKETKVACCLTLNVPAASESDPQPEPPAKFLDPPRVVKLVQQVKARSAIAGVVAGGGGSAGRNQKKDTDKKGKDEKATPGATRRERDKAGKSKRAKRLVRTAVATMADAAAFGWQVGAEVHRRGLDRAARKACVCDGQRYNWSIYDLHLAGAGFVGILDFLHLLVYLYAAAQAWMGRGSVRAWECYERWLRAAWAGRTADLLTDLGEASAKLGPPPKGADKDEQDPRRVVADALTYVSNNQERMDYPRYRKLGLPISSAPVESLIKQFNRRVKGSEKFWLKGGAEAVLQVRAAYLSEDGRADRYWSRPRPHRRAAGHGPLPQRQRQLA